MPTPIADDKILAITLTERHIAIGSVEGLQGWRVVISGGHRWAESRLAALGIQPLKTNTVSRFMELLRVSRVDVGLIEESFVSALGDMSGMTQTRIATLPYYLVLHRDNQHHIAALDRAIQVLKTQDIAPFE